FDNGDPYNPHIDISENLVYFQSVVDNVRGSVGGDVGIVYRYNLSENRLEKITTQNTGSMGYLFPNYTAKQMLNAHKPERSENNYQLLISDLAGGNMT